MDKDISIASLSTFEAVFRCQLTHYVLHEVRLPGSWSSAYFQDSRITSSPFLERIVVIYPQGRLFRACWEEILRTQMVSKFLEEQIQALCI